MSSRNRADAAAAARGRIDRSLDAVRLGLGPYVAKHMSDRYGERWREHASRARGADTQGELDVYGLLKTLLDNWSELFRHDQKLRKVRSFISHALDARNTVAHFSGEMSARETLRYLDAMRELLAAVEAKAEEATVEALYEEQRKANGVDRSPQSQLELEPPAPEQLRPWREVCEPHPDVLEARFSDAEFAANLALVDEGVGAEEYTDPAAFFRITYATEGLRRVLISTIARLAGRGGDPVIGLQTNFGGGKTHTMLALYHLGGAAEAGYRPEDLQGLRPLFDAAGVDTLGPVQRAVFVGTHKGASEAMHVEGGREIRTPWGYLVWRLGGWKAVETIADSERAGTNPGSERLIPILREAAPCLILMDEVVAFARQLRDLQYDAFHAFVQSLTEAAAAVPGAVVVGSLPESGTEVGDEQGHDALRRLEKIFGRVQSAWTPASGIETFEIVRRRLFQPLDEAGERARDETIQAFRRLYRDNRADFPAEVREAAYEELMRRAYPLHPEVLRRFSGDWSVLEKFQRTRGILKIMANAVYALWSNQSRAALITPALLPFYDQKVRTALLEPLDRAYGAILQSEVDGDQSLPARIEAQRPRLLRARAATLAARAVFFATAPHVGAARGGMTGTELRLACAQPGDQIAIFGEALQELASRSAHLYRDEDRFWFSPQPTLRKLAADRARDVSEEQADARIVEVLREEQRGRAGFARVHAVPDNPTDVEDRRTTALVILPPSATHEANGDTATPGVAYARETMERRGAGQRQYRNALLFVAPDASKIDAARENARRERAWRSIVDDVDLRQQLTQAQTSEAEREARRSRDALQQSVRSAWVQVLHPGPPDETTGDGGVGAGYVMRCTRLVNRGGTKSVTQIVWDKVSTDGTLFDQIGPENLARSLEPIWPSDRNHLAIATIRDWVASYVYMPRLRDEATLDGAVQRLVEDMAFDYAFASAFDEETGTYTNVVDGSLVLPDRFDEGLLVRRSAIARAKPAKTDEVIDRDGTVLVIPPSRELDDRKKPPSEPPRPKRFFANVDVDAERAGLEVARIMDGLLVELTRGAGSTVRISVEIQGRAQEAGYPADVVETVKANARDLKLDENAWGFESE